MIKLQEINTNPKLNLRKTSDTHEEQSEIWKELKLFKNIQSRSYHTSVLYKEW